MSDRGSGTSESFWLWDGEVEYEGRLVSVNGRYVAARMRQTRRWTLASGAPGKPVPLNLIERQRGLVRRVCFAQSPSVHEGSLLEFNIEAVQPSGDPHFDFVLGGTFAKIADEHLAALSQGSSQEAFRYLQSRRAGPSANASFGS